MEDEILFKSQNSDFETGLWITRYLHDSDYTYEVHSMVSINRFGTFYPAKMYSLKRLNFFMESARRAGWEELVKEIQADIDRLSILER